MIIPQWTFELQMVCFQSGTNALEIAYCPIKERERETNSVQSTVKFMHGLPQLSVPSINLCFYYIVKYMNNLSVNCLLPYLLRC